MKKIILLLFIVLSSIFNLGCPDDGVQPPPNPLQLVVEDATCTEAFLKISLATNELNRTVTLKRGDSSIATITMTSGDSLFVDEGLLPKKSYTYTLAKESWSISAQATTQDTTSHEVQWQLPDTLGAQGVIRDVWVFSKTDAWAVGEIYLKDSTGKIDNANPYNAAHWNGIKWEIKKITVNFRGNTITPPLEGIFAFSPTQIWLAGSLPIFGDGSTWTIYDLRTTLDPNISVSKAWGVSSVNMYFIGGGGSITHYLNGNWTKMESNTTVNLEDIWGIDETHIWATGTTTSNGHSVVLQYDGTQWTTIYENTNKPLNEIFGFNSVWTDRTDRIYLAGESNSMVMNLSNKTFQSLKISMQQWAALRIRGMNRRDIFQVGYGSEVVHFNGITWSGYQEIEKLNNGGLWFRSISTTQEIILLGGDYLTQFNSFPTVIRGYR